MGNNKNCLSGLPDVIIENIFSNIIAYDLYSKVRLTSRFFAKYLCVQSPYWTLRNRRYKSFVPLNTGKNIDEDFQAKAAIKIERIYNNFNNPDGYKKIVKRPHTATITASKIFKPSHDRTFVITGSRDRSICLQDFEPYRYLNEDEDNDIETTYIKIENAHDGWISSICFKDNYILSNGWDSTLKIWSLTNRGLETVTSMKGTSAYLDCAVDGETIYCCGYEKAIAMFDFRERLKLTNRLFLHSHSILKVLTEKGSNYLYSVGGDESVALFDKRNMKIACTKKLYDQTYCVALYNESLYISNSDGSLDYMKTNTLDKMGTIYIDDDAQDIEIKNMTIDDGYIVYSRNHINDLRVYTFCNDPRQIAQFPSSTSICSFDIKRGDVVFSEGSAQLHGYLCK
ncbi:WD40 repeat and WD40/YVTN repeat-like-containing domain and WD40-repeat-containing domain-containing protein [Strongyloides ratti]|uniref:WD40 repeat and WD40/YVTN repeat-like-containing domain and WD40-repeat-containing domain-containing protein n=1 Tax=Strongyloides ratti TaxID=34506 RepID=A0A090KV12_STRRB|nr:WD40 repeat and WD40/YVTN repeat-like-containing domain and WD40-repeat-containing domain-containing protein [Strongyloides ratti]CEF61231.1 WD40 repeat and WD40/YVTN repeat-like-containing domain and WD40-repeat-containing domain-containing protein [Strongyloides ratti]